MDSCEYDDEEARRWEMVEDFTNFTSWLWIMFKIPYDISTLAKSGFHYPEGGPRHLFTVNVISLMILIHYPGKCRRKMFGIIFKINSDFLLLAANEIFAFITACIAFIAFESLSSAIGIYDYFHSWFWMYFVDRFLFLFAVILSTAIPPCFIRVWALVLTLWSWRYNVRWNQTMNEINIIYASVLICSVCYVIIFHVWNSPTALMKLSQIKRALQRIRKLCQENVPMFCRYLLNFTLHKTAELIGRIALTTLCNSFKKYGNGVIAKCYNFSGTQRTRDEFTPTKSAANITSSNGQKHRKIRKGPKHSAGGKAWVKACRRLRGRLPQNAAYSNTFLC